jgi:hypothetical protein
MTTWVLTLLFRVGPSSPAKYQYAPPSTVKVPASRAYTLMRTFSGLVSELILQET